MVTDARPSSRLLPFRTVEMKVAVELSVAFTVFVLGLLSLTIVAARVKEREARSGESGQE